MKIKAFFFLFRSILTVFKEYFIMKLTLNNHYEHNKAVNFGAFNGNHPKYTHVRQGKAI